MQKMNPNKDSVWTWDYLDCQSFLQHPVPGNWLPTYQPVKLGVWQIVFSKDGCFPAFSSTMQTCHVAIRGQSRFPLRSQSQSLVTALTIGAGQEVTLFDFWGWVIKSDASYASSTFAHWNTPSHLRIPTAPSLPCCDGAQVTWRGHM